MRLNARGTNIECCDWPVWVVVRAPRKNLRRGKSVRGPHAAASAIVFPVVRLADRDLRFAQNGRGHVVGRIDTGSLVVAPHRRRHDRRISARCSGSTPTGMTMPGSPQAAGEHRSTCRCRSCATNRVIGAMPGRRANGSGSYRSAVRLLPRVMRRHRIRSGTNTKRSGDVCSAAAATWKMPWTSSAGTNHRTRRQLGIPLTDAQRLYLAYHEGQGGYRRGTWMDKPKVQRAARRVAATSDRYRAQLARCESSFRCDSWYQVWPFCR